jgi:glycosyltransferase involved in cell wall biosynthesis
VRKLQTCTPNQTIYKRMRQNFLFETMTILSVDDSSFLTHRLPMAMAAKKVSRTVWVICKDTGKCEEIRKIGFSVINLSVGDAPLNIFANLKMLRQLTGIYETVQPDLVYHSSVQMSFLGSLACLFTVNPPSINAITGVGYLFSSEQLKAKFLRWALGPVLKVLWRREGAIMLFQNPDDRAVFAKRGLSFKNAPLIPGSGVDDSKFKPVVKNCSPRKNNRPLVIGCASRLLRDKGIPELIEAIKIAEKNCKIELRVAGNIYSKNPSSCTRRDMEQWSNIPSVKFLGNVTDMMGFWHDCDVAILPSHREGFPKALLEAAASGLPLLGTDVPGVREIVLDGVNGLLFAKGDCQDIAEKINKIYNDYKFRMSAGRASLRMIKSKGLSSGAVETAFVELFASIKTHAGFASER